MDIREAIKGLPNRCEDETNRGYVGWGPYEDYLWNESESWAGRIIQETWADFYEGFKDCDDDYNLVIDYYFDISYEAKRCETCDGSGYNPQTKQISDDFYDFAHTGRKWCANVTQDEVQALIDANRLWDFTREVVDGKWRDKEPPYIPTAEEVNAANRLGAPALGSHDAINRFILIEARAKRLGVWGECSECEGDGSIRLSDDRLELNVWLAHPRKGASRGIHIKSVQIEDLPEVKTWLARSWTKHQEHFAWVLA